MKGTVTDRAKRLETYCRQTKLSNGNTVMDEFEKTENKLKQQALKRAELEQQKAPMFSREKILNDFSPALGNPQNQKKKKSHEKSI